MRKMRETWERRGKIRLGFSSRRTSDLNPSICPAANTITSTSNRRRKYGIAGFLTLKRGTNLVQVETKLRYVTTELAPFLFLSSLFTLFSSFFFQSRFSFLFYWTTVTADREPIKGKWWSTRNVSPSYSIHEPINPIRSTEKNWRISGSG